MGNCFSSLFPGTNSKSKDRTQEKLVAPPSDEEGQDAPKTVEYMVQAVKKLATTVDGVAGFIPIPLLPELVKIAITVIEACEARDATAIEESVKDLQKRIFSLSVIFIDEFHGKDSEELQGRIEKLQSTLNTILKDLDKIKAQKKILLLLCRDLNKETVDKCLYRVNEALEQFHLAHEINLEDWVQDILSKYSDLSTQLSDITHQLKELQRTVENVNQPHHVPVILQPDIRPTSPMYGRKFFVDAIASLLANEDTSRVCITGAGGMGKTRVAHAVMDSAIVNKIFPKEYQFWVPCVGAPSASIFLRILYTQLRVTAESYDSIDTLINELNASKQRRVLLLDNFETPCFSWRRRQSGGTLLVTMTSAFPPSEDVVWHNQLLPPLDPAAARDAFKGVYPGTVDEKLDELLEAIGRVPLAITFMATDAKHFQVSPKDLLEEWERAGTDMISSMDRRIGLSVTRVQSNSAALTLLAILSLLPAGTTVEWQEEGEFANARIFVSPTVQAYMAQQARISDEVRQQVHDACYTFVLAHTSTPDEAKFKQDLSALAKEEKNIQVLLMQTNVATLRPHALDALIAFGMYQYWTKPSTVVALHALELALAVQDDAHVHDPHVAARHVAEAHQCLGKIFHRLDGYEEACPHFESARRGFKSLLGRSDRLRAGECSMELAGTWMGMKKPSPEVQLLVLDAQADLSHDKTDKFHVARGLLALGDFLWYTTQYKQALETLSSATAIFEELNRPASTSQCLHLIARLHAKQGKHTDALGIAKQALEKGAQAGDLRLIGDILNVTARYLIGLSSSSSSFSSSLYDEAITIIERALSTYQALGSPLGIAETLELLGYASAARMDLAGARDAYERARVQFGNVRSLSAELNGARCTRNLDRLEPTKLSILEKPFLY
ncbi:hypothetical protein FB451DRAFT_1548359 [Mycena latifolia]|nr:hypothetical protein FB451DRAFT_1548359 [Mycena latifolia]